MNRHRSNWSAMGPGFSKKGWSPVTSVEEYKQLLKDTLTVCDKQDAFNNLIVAVRELKQELEIG